MNDLNAAQAKGLRLALYDIDPSCSWEDHLTFIFKSCVIHYNRQPLKQIIYSISDAQSNAEAFELLDRMKLLMKKELKIGLFITDKSMFLNRYVSNIPESFWHLADRNTNIAESAHANINHDGKTRHFDECQYTSINVHTKFGIGNSGRDKGVIARTALTIKCCSVKPKRKSSTQKTSLKKSCTTDEDDIELSERRIALRERELNLKKQEIEIRVLELDILFKEK
ncbi:12312_t:CDS:2, partial [Ambispora leptoticha]